mgnify:CR=1 FL=1
MDSDFISAIKIYDEIIVDFDGVLTRLSTDWNSLKHDLGKRLDIHDTLSLQEFYLYAITTNRRDAYLALVRQYEKAGIDKKLSPLGQYLSTGNSHVSIVTNNSVHTVKKFLDLQPALRSKVRAIVGVEDVIFYKPHPEGIKKVLNVDKKTVMIGDSLNDKIASRLCNIDFLSYVCPQPIDKDQRIDNASGWYTTHRGLNSYMIYCTYLEAKQYIGGNLLEVGAADGFMTGLIQRDALADSYDIIEASSRYAEVLSKKFPKINVSLGFLEDMSVVKTYDTIIAGHVLEHVENPVLFLKKIKRLLAKNGKCIVSVPNAHSMHRLLGVDMGMLSNVHELNDQDRKIGHYRVYDVALLKRHLCQAGFTVLQQKGSFMKFLSNKQYEKMIPRQDWNAYYQMGKNFMNYCADIIIICE